MHFSEETVILWNKNTIIAIKITNNFVEKCVARIKVNKV